MSHPIPSQENSYPEDKVSHYPKKKTLMEHGMEIVHQGKRLKGLMETKHFGAKHGARHEAAKSKALKKKRGESTSPF